MSDVSIETLHEIVKDIKDDTKEIKEQVKKTNGRVTALESWRGFITGGLAVVTVLLIPVIIFFITKSLSPNKATADEIVSQLEEKYEIQIK